MKYYTSQKGFVVLFTVLISSIVLLMSLGIMSISTKEVLLSIQSRDAAKAFFAADAGMECALYADRQHTGGSAFLAGDPVSCNGVPVNMISTTSPYQFYVDLGSNANVGCAKVTVTTPYSYVNSSGNTVQMTSKIESLGYNTPFTSDGDCGQLSDANNPRRIERGYRATY